MIIERGAESFGAYLPDVPGCVAAADTRDEVIQLIQEALAMHLEGMREDGEPLPDPVFAAEYVTA